MTFLRHSALRGLRHEATRIRKLTDDIKSYSDFHALEKALTAGYGPQRHLAVHCRTPADGKATRTNLASAIHSIIPNNSGTSNGSNRPQAHMGYHSLASL